MADIDNLLFNILFQAFDFQDYGSVTDFHLWIRVLRNTQMTLDEYWMIVGMSMDEFLTSVESREIDDLDESELIVLGNCLVSTVLSI